MKVAKGETLPETAGKAKLRFVSGIDMVPWRDGDTITLGTTVRPAELFLLQDGQQFLLHLGEDRRRSAFFPELFWFGGTDENVFLVRLNERPYGAFLNGGEAAFYEMLKPRIVKIFEKRFAVSAKRQGDIWAVPLPCSWEEFGKFNLVYWGEELRLVEEKSFSLFRTRHRFTGLMSRHVHSVFPNTNWFLVEGRIEAPDHSPLVLKEVHAVTQTEHLYDPPKAD